ncbi:MAG: T9SS type A sorting domain-containing protein [Bacteroidota bacterium]
MRPFQNVLYSLLLFLCFCLTTTEVRAQGYFSLMDGCIDDATVAVAFTGETEIGTCGGDGESDRIRFATSNLFMAFGYVVVDDNDIIVSIGFSNFIDFDMLPLGTLRVYAFSNYGFITASVGEDFNTAVLAVPCFGLTTNFVTVINGSPGENTIASDQGEVIDVCTSDGQPDLINFTATNNGPNTAYVITDAGNVVLDVNTTGAIDFEGVGAGECRVWGVSYSTSIPFEAGDVLIPGNGCSFVSTNFITINRTSLAGAVVTLADGGTEIQTCPGDGEDDLIDFAVGGEAGTTTLVVTDDAGNILGVPPALQVNFEGAGEGTCRVYSLNYEGELLAAEGGNLNDGALATGCYGLSEDFVTVVRISAEGGSIRTIDNRTEVAVCPGDGTDNSVLFVADGAGGGEFLYVITDENNIILSTSTDPNIDFDDAPLGICRVWGLSYQGELLAEAGDDAANTELSSGCFDLSDNFVRVNRTAVDGGNISLEDGSVETQICPGDGIDDLLNFLTAGVEGDSFVLLITDGNNEVLGFVRANSINFDNTGEGNCRVWGLAYTGDITAMVGDDAVTSELATGCFDLSDNFVNVIRESPTGGTIATDEGESQVEVCPGDGNPDEFTFAVTGNEGAEFFSLLITDENNVVIGTPAGLTVDFDGAGPGICRVWGISYNGNLLAAMGDDATMDQLADGCYSLTDDFVTVVRQSPEGGTVSTEAGETEILVCPNNGTPDVVRFDSTGNADLANFNYVITDENNEILLVLFGDSFNFDGSGIGVCRVWGLSYDGVLLAGNGDDASTTTLASDCFALSDNFITVNREVPSGGTVATEAGETEVFVCPDDGIDDIISFSSSGASGGSFTYVVTDADNIILGVPEGNTVNFETAGLGVCRLWGLSYQGDLLAMEGDDAANTQLASGCFELSANFVTVTRDEIMGGTVSTTDGDTEVTTCVGDGIEDLVSFASEGAIGQSFTYVVTDENNMILGVPAGNSQDFEGAPAGVCRVWGLAYAGDLLAMEGDIASAVDLASGCFALSDNFITVTRTVPEGGTISSSLGDSINVCSGDNIADLVDYSAMGNSPGNYTFIVTSGGIFVAEVPAEGFDFDNAVSQVFEIRGLAYAGQLNLLPGDDINEVDLATSCFDLSDNFITVTVTALGGGTISANGSTDFIYLCPANAAANTLTFESTVAAQAPSEEQYVITTLGGGILAPLGPGVNTFDFNGFPIEAVRVYRVNYTGAFTGGIGMNIEEATLSDDCFVLSDNFLTIINEAPDAGEISIEDELFCAINGNNDLVVTSTTSSLAGYAILVTDAAGIIQLIATDPAAVDLGSLPEADYQLFGLSFTGDITAMVGDDINLVALANNCFELTMDAVSVTRAETLEGGILSTLSGQDTVYVCPQDGTPDIIGVLTTVSGVPYRFAVTDENGSILLPAAVSNVFNFDNNDPGVCRIYGYAFSGNPTAFFGQDINEAPLSDRCFALSENYITVVREVPEGGSVTTADGATEATVVLGSDDTVVEVVSTGAAPLASFTYLVTDDNNVVLGMGDGPSFDFADAPAGVCRIWGLSYVGDLLVMMGDTASTAMLASNCWALSTDFVTVTRVAGRGFTDVPTEATQIELTPFPNPADGDQLRVVVESDHVLGDGRAFVRDQNGRAWATRQVAGGSTTAVVDFDISNLPPGLFVVQYQSEGELRVVRFIRQ